MKINSYKKEKININSKVKKNILKNFYKLVFAQE